MKDTIKFETANLAEKAGYPFEYTDIDNINRVPLNIPTQAELRKWLRDVHKIEISVKYSFNTKGYHCRFASRKEEGYHWGRENNVPTTKYEDSLEIVLGVALKTI